MLISYLINLCNPMSNLWHRGFIDCDKQGEHRSMCAVFDVSQFCSYTFVKSSDLKQKHQLKV